MTIPNTSAVLLCSGTSSRMFPFSNKFMFEFLGKSVFRSQMENLLQQKTINEIFIVTNSENKETIEAEISKYFSDISKFQKKITCTIQENLSNGMKDGVLSVENNFPKNDNILIISSNDMVENWFLTDFLEKNTSSQICGKLCGKTVENYFPGGYLEIDSEKNVQKIIEKPGEGNEPSNLINLVIHWFQDSKKVFELLKSVNNSEDDAYELMIQELIDSSVEIAKRSELHTFKVIPKRWVVERSFGWLDKCRRLWKNCERQLNTSLQIAITLPLSSITIL